VVEIPDGEELVYKAAVGTAVAHAETRIPMANSLSGLCLQAGTALRCDDASCDERVHTHKCRAVGAVSMLCVPLRHGASVVGVLKVYTARPHAFNDDHTSLLELLSTVIAARMSTGAEFERLNVESLRNQRKAIAGLRALARAIDAKDPMTRQHSDRVATLATEIARRRGWSEDQTGLLHEAALLHDVGKIGIPDSILLKPGRLTATEYSQVKEHAALGATIVEGLLNDEQVNWIRWHHERPDGHGYPDALTDAAIPEGAAIIALSDTWDVMTISRPYSPPMSATDAIQECRQLAGKQFRASLVEVLIDIVS
jgi:putative nucleotidyltransferase with HDIG domain